MKDALRDKWKKVRQSIPSYRRAVAEDLLFEELAHLPGPVLSFFSFQNEISTNKINQHYASQNRLFLPRVDGHELKIYAVRNPDEQCIPNQWGIFEPDPSLVKEARIQNEWSILVPALAFDENRHRLGYGKGCYDRLLASVPASIHAIGIGFKEQLSQSPLPTDPHDISLDRVLLF